MAANTNINGTGRSGAGRVGGEEPKSIDPIQDFISSIFGNRRTMDDAIGDFIGKNYKLVIIGLLAVLLLLRD